jgi:hypothetical protein
VRFVARLRRRIGQYASAAPHASGTQATEYIGSLHARHHNCAVVDASTGAVAEDAAADDEDLTITFFILDFPLLPPPSFC